MQVFKKAAITGTSLLKACEELPGGDKFIGAMKDKEWKKPATSIVDPVLEYEMRIAGIFSYCRRCSS